MLKVCLSVLLPYLLYGFFICALADAESFVVSQAIEICNLHGKERGLKIALFEA